MSISDVRKELVEIKLSAEAGNLDQVKERVSRALHTLDEHRLLTTTEAAEYLNIRSVNTLKLLVRQMGIPYERHGNRMMIALHDVEQLHQSQITQGLRASDQAHDASATLGAAPLNQGELDALSAERPGRAPWQNESDSHDHE